MSQNLDLPVLPAVEQALKPFIKSPSEITLIRRHLNATLETLIASSTSPTPSLTSQRAVKCLTGTRKAYYNAAVENLRLRKQWAELASDIKLPVPEDTQPNPKPTLAQVHSHKRNSSSFSNIVIPPTDWTQTYDQVLELRRVLSQLTILNKYQQRITALTQSRNRPLTAVFTDYNQQVLPAPPGGPLAIKYQTGGGSGEDDVLLPLEKAVVDAQTRLDVEKKLLAETKEALKGVNLEKLPEEVRTAGMVAAKEELEVWLDEQLRLAGEGSATPKKGKGVGETASNGEIWDGDGKFDLDEQLEEIKKGYESYVESREKMLHAFLLANQPIKKEVIPPKAGRDRSSTAAAANQTDKSDIPELLGVMDELGYWNEKTNELTELMKAMKDGSAKAAKDLESTMGKLRSESQLLDNYGGGGVRIQQKGAAGESPFHGSVELAKLWEVAAEEAERSTSDEVDKDTSYAREKLAQVEEMLQQLRELLPEEEKSTGKRKKDTSWRGLRGNVGFDDI
ncbi:hypothetical protein ABW20_dc0100471 [Dactylellina cionopaga]|nr:hypothetical protein ABW20_dc0100471 [Dactylellina cionopaga]